MPRFVEAFGASFYAATERWVNAALRSDDSLFTPGRSIWNAANIEELYRRFVLNQNHADVSFMTRLERQVRDAPPAAIQLAAELLYVHLLAPQEMRGATKRERIETVLSWLPEPVSLPEDLAQALEHGIARVGIAFLTQRPAQLRLLIEFVRRWKQLPEEERRAGLADPWTFKRILFDVPHHSGYAQREALLHLVHPDTFEPIVSRAYKVNYARQFAHLLREPSDDVDRQLLQIRQQLAPDYGDHFFFHEVSGAVPARHILPRMLGERLRPYVELVAHLNGPAYTPEQIVDLLGQLTPPLVMRATRPDPDQLVAELLMLRLLEPLEDGLYRRWPHLADATLEHLLRYAALTLLVPGDHDDYRLPVLEAPFDGQPHPVADWPVGEDLLHWYEEAGLVRRVGDGVWQAHPDALAPLADATPTAQAINTFLDHLRRTRATPELPPLEDAPLPTLPPDVLEARIAEIQRELLIDRQTLLRIYRSLIAGHHVILSGPPGTGKTHLARLLPQIFWRGLDRATRYELRQRPEQPPTAPPEEVPLAREGYAVTMVTATEDWGVRHVIGGIVPQLRRDGASTTLIYTVRHGYLTSAVLQNYHGYDGAEIPTPSALRRAEVRENGRRFRGRWLVIDEFTRAPIDAAFGSLLTTLSGQRQPTIAVPTDAGDEWHVPLPHDFRIIGTLNSFDRHFLNQISEAMKRRFTFIDVLPPARALARAEQGMAVYRALLRLQQQGLPGYSASPATGTAAWDGVLAVQREERPDEPDIRVWYTVTFHDEDAARACDSFWRVFQAIRVYRQLGTAQAEAVLATLFAGRVIGMAWRDALDAALADVIGDQLQVLTRDEQRALLAYLAHAAAPERFAEHLRPILDQMPPPRREAHLRRLRLAGADIDPLADDTMPTAAQLAQVFPLGQPLLIDDTGLFAARVSAFVSEMGL